MWIVTLYNLFLYSDPPPILSPSFLLAEAVFEPNLFPYKYSNILKPSHSSFLSTFEDGTECSETSANKIQTPGNYPEESMQHSEHGESLKSRNKYCSKQANQIPVCVCVRACVCISFH